MTFQDYHARAELYLGSDRHTAMAQGGRFFATAAQAIRFAFEEAAPVSLHGAMLRIGDATFAGDSLAALYRSAEFPLPRKTDIKRSRVRRARQYQGMVHQFARSVTQRHAALA
ncbi:hypothetical protein ASD04_18165 [Devosia sp. Root436]|uniref:hypothetical protein n=1 Tax=Devosia sp. Root436 TaxID=1736537 RepID=UPI0006F5B5F2|nr:hypothetical protein [Devosia sp. Root436]KQX41989.1 hypothetical protein ASD04_18165 [Devosia sp. Root436]